MAEEQFLLKRKKKFLKEKNFKQLQETYLDLGDFYREKTCYENAIDEYKEFLKISKQLNDKLNEALGHRKLGEVFLDIKKFDDALEHAKLYLDKAQNLENEIEKQQALITLGRTYYLQAEDENAKDPLLQNYKSILKKAKKVYEKAIMVCHSLEKSDQNPGEKALMLMRARAQLNYGLVLELLEDYEESLQNYQAALKICLEYNFYEDLYRTYCSLAVFYEKKSKHKLALEYYKNASLVKNIKKEDKFLSELLMCILEYKFGNLIEAKKLLVIMWKKWHKEKEIADQDLKDLKQKLKKVVKACKIEDQIIIEDDLENKINLYEDLGDILSHKSLEAYDKALHYYQEMLSYAEIVKKKIAPALNSIARTLQDLRRFEVAIPYAKRELEMCHESQEISKSSYFIANLLIDAEAADEDIKEMFDVAWANAKVWGDCKFQKLVLEEFIYFMEKSKNVNSNEVQILREELSKLEDHNEKSEEKTQSSDTSSDIDIEELSDLESENETEVTKERVPVARRRPRCIVKKNEKGESQLHVACIKGNVEQVDKLLNNGHPVDIRDACGWTPLHEAANHGFIEIINLLIEYGANINDPGGSGCGGITPLMDAASNGLTSVINLLLSHGANPNLTSDNGETALFFLDACRNRAGSLTVDELADYEATRKKLLQHMSKIEIKKNFKTRKNKSESSNSSMDKDFVYSGSLTNSTMETDKISATEYYQQAMQALKRPGRRMISSATISKTKSPLIDANESISKEWLINDLESNVANKDNFYKDPLAAISSISKRKSNYDDAEGDIEALGEKNTKKQKRRSFDEIVDIPGSRSPVSSDGSIEMTSNFDDFEHKNKKRVRRKQLSLLKSGFTKNKPLLSRTPSPTLDTRIEKFSSYNLANHTPESYNSPTEKINLTVSIQYEIIDLKLHFPRDQNKTIEAIAAIIQNKFKDITGCQVKIDLKSEDGGILTSEATLAEIPRLNNCIKLYGELSEIFLPPISERYKKVCENDNIGFSEAMIKSLKSSENTCSFRLPSSEINDEEITPLLTCLSYEKNLQDLHLSGGLLFRHGIKLNRILSSLINLNELYLQASDIDGNCLLSIEKFPSKLRVLDLSYNPIGTKCIGHFIELLKPLSYLQTLKLSYCEIERFDFKLEKNSLLHLDISYNPMGGNSVINLIQQHILKLNLANTQSIQMNHENVIDVVFFKNSKLNDLEELNLSACDVTDLDIERISSQLPNLTKITLCNNVNITENSLCTLLNRKPTMNFIDLSGCSIIYEKPCGVRIMNPEICYVFAHIEQQVLDEWEKLWQGKTISKKLPSCLVQFKPK